MSWVIGVSGLFVFAYRAFNYIFVRLLSTKLAIESQIAIITMKDLMINPTMLFFLGIFLLSISTAFLMLSIVYNREKDVKYKVHEILIYSLLYVFLYPAILIVSLIKYLRGYSTW